VLGSFLTGRRRVAVEARKQAEAEWAESSTRGGSRLGLAAAARTASPNRAMSNQAVSNRAVSPSRAAGRPFGPFDGNDDAGDETVHSDGTDDGPDDGTVVSARPFIAAEPPRSATVAAGDVNPFAGSPAAAPRFAPADTGHDDPTPPALPDPPVQLPQPATAESLRPAHAAHPHPHASLDEHTAGDGREAVAPPSIGWPQSARPAAVGAPSLHEPRPAAEPAAPDHRFAPMAGAAPAPVHPAAEPGWAAPPVTISHAHAVEPAAPPQPFEPFAPFAEHVSPAPVTSIDPRQAGAVEPASDPYRVGSADPFRYVTPEQVAPEHSMPGAGVLPPTDDSRSTFVAPGAPAPTAAQAHPHGAAAFAYPDDLYRSPAAVVHEATFAAAPAPGTPDPIGYGHPYPAPTGTTRDHTYPYGVGPEGADPHGQAHPAHVEQAYEPTGYATVPSGITAAEPAHAPQAYETQHYDQHTYDQRAYAEPAFEHAPYTRPGYADPTSTAYAQPVYAEVEPHAVHAPATHADATYPEAPHAAPAHHEPAHHEPAYHEAAYTQPAHHEPAYHETAYTQPAYHEPAHHETVSTQPVYQEAPYAEPARHEVGVAPAGDHLPAHLVVAPTGTPHAPRTAPATPEETREAWRRAFPQTDQRDLNGPGAFAPAPGYEAQPAPALTQQPAANLFHTRPAHLGGPAGFNGGPGDPDGAMARLPRRRREDLAPAAEEPAPLPTLADLPPGYTDPITGLPLADAMRADIELRATDFKQFTVVVCHPMIAAIGSDGTVAAFPKVPVDEEQIRVFAEVLRESLRQRDIVGRYDERLFLLFLARASVSEVRIPMDRIRTNLLHAQRGQTNWVDIAFGAAEGTIGQSVDGPLKAAYADLLRRNAGPAWFLRP